jgi:hypothetical protein
MMLVRAYRRADRGLDDATPAGHDCRPAAVFRHGSSSKRFTALVGTWQPTLRYTTFDGAAR